MGFIVKITIIILIIICIIYLFLYLKKKKGPSHHFAFAERQKDLVAFISELYPGQFKDPEDWAKLLKLFEKEYPLAYKRIDKKFLDNYFKD